MQSNRQLGIPTGTDLYSLIVRDDRIENGLLPFAWRAILARSTLLVLVGGEPNKYLRAVRLL